MAVMHAIIIKSPEGQVLRRCTRCGFRDLTLP